jgi:multiple sugar transport system substrate-binding protein
VRTTFVTVIAGVTAIALAACTGGGGGGSLGNGSTSSGDAGGAKSITVITSQSPWAPAYAKVVAAYTAKTGVKVDLRPFPNNVVGSQAATDAQSGTHTYDVYQLLDPSVATYNKNNWLTPFNKIVPGFTPDKQIYSYDNVAKWDAKTQSFSPSGQTTVLPLIGSVLVLYYRKDIYDKLGLKVPTTWDQVIENGKKAQQAGLAKYGFVFPTQAIGGSANSTYPFEAMVQAAGGEFFGGAPTNYRPTIDSAAALKAATWERELAQLGPADSQTVGQAQAVAAFQAGNAAQLFTVAAAAAATNDPANSSVVGKVGVAPAPQDSHGKPATTSGLWTLGVPSGLSHDRQVTALDFIKFITSEQGQKIFAESGGIPVRSDAIASATKTDFQKSYLKAVSESAPYAGAQFRELNAPDLYTASEPVVSNIASGQLSPQQGVQQLQQQFLAIMQKSNYPVK